MTFGIGKKQNIENLNYKSGQEVKIMSGEIKRYTVTSQNDVVRCVSGVTFNNQKQAFDYAKELAKTVKQSVWMIEDVFKRSDLGKRFVSKRTALVYPDGRFELI